MLSTVLVVMYELVCCFHLKYIPFSNKNGHCSAHLKHSINGCGPAEIEPHNTIQEKGMNLQDTQTKMEINYICTTCH